MRPIQGSPTAHTPMRKGGARGVVWDVCSGGEWEVEVDMKENEAKEVVELLITKLTERIVELEKQNKYLEQGYNYLGGIIQEIDKIVPKNPEFKIDWQLRSWIDSAIKWIKL